MQITDQIEHEHHKRTSLIASKTVDAIGYGCGSFVWVASQIGDKDNYIGVAFTLRDDSVGIKQRYAFISKDDFIKTDDELIAHCAQQILGYPLSSKQDYERRIAFQQSLIEKTEAELAEVKERLKRQKYGLQWLNAGLRVKTDETNNADL